VLWEIIRKEILENVKSPKFVFTFLLCTILISMSVYIGANNYRTELREYKSAVALNKKSLESRGFYSAVAEKGTKVFKVPQVLSTIVTGINKAVGRWTIVNNRDDPSFVDSKYESNPLFAIFGELDLTLIIKIVLSLLVVVFTYDAIAGEKEQGSLRLIISNNVPRYLLILGKAIGNFICLILPLIISLLLGLIIFVIHPDILLSGEDWIRILLIFILFLLYLSVFFMLGLFISSRTSRSLSSLFILLLIWVIFIFIIPKTAVMVARQIDPIPSVHEITAQKDAFLQEMVKYAEKRSREWNLKNAHIFTQKNREEAVERVKKFTGDLQKEIIAKTIVKNAELDEEYQAKLRKQQILAMSLSRVSPASVLTFGTMSLAKTGIHEHERFLNSVKTYKPVFANWANSKFWQRVGGAETVAKLKPEPFLNGMPQHYFRPESLRDSFARAMPDFVILILMSILFFTGAFVSFLRYDVR